MKGSITIYLALTLSICLGLIGSILEGARASGLQSQLRLAADSALDSLFAGYDGDLFAQYGILALNQAESERAIADHLAEYLSYELHPVKDQLLAGGTFYREDVESVNLDEVHMLTAQGGRLFKQEVLEYMKYAGIGDLLEEVGQQLQLLQQGETANENTSDKKWEVDHTDWNMYVPPEEAKEGSDDEGNRYDKERYEEEMEQSIVAQVDALRGGGFLQLVLPSEAVLSDAKLTKKGMPSTDKSVDTLPKRSGVEEFAERLLYNEYVLSHFTSFVSAKKNYGMQYEVEYILYGKESDVENLKAFVNQFMWVREGLNILHILSSSEKMAELSALAATLVGWTFIPPLVTLVKYLLVAAWAYAESIMDARALLGGGKVPLIKDKSNWTLSLSGIGKLMEGGGTEEIKSDGKGLDYQAYLRLFLVLQDETDKYYQTMDMIQDNIAGSKPGFSIGSCIYGMTITVQTKAALLWPLGGNGNQMRRTACVGRTY